MRNVMLLNSISLMVQAEFSPVNCPLSSHSHQPPCPPLPPLHLIVPVEWRLMNLKVISEI